MRVDEKSKIVSWLVRIKVLVLIIEGVGLGFDNVYLDSKDFF